MNRRIKLIATLLIAVTQMLIAIPAMATDTYLPNLTITRLRAVGDYVNGTISDYTFEVWFNNNTVTYAAGTRCDSTFKVFIDAKNKHIVALAMLALSTGRKVHINVDDTLPIRYGSCEVSFLDVDP